MADLRSDIPDAMPEHLETSTADLENRFINDLENLIDRYSGCGFTYGQVLGSLEILKMRMLDRWWGIVNAKDEEGGFPAS